MVQSGHSQSTVASWGTVGGQLGHSQSTVGAQSGQSQGTVGAQSGHSQGTVGVQSGHSRSKWYANKIKLIHKNQMIFIFILLKVNVNKD